MTEHPILFSGPMVRAILDGRKIQTRRAMRPQIDLSQWPLKPGALEKEKEWRYMPRVADWHHIEENMWGLFNKEDKPSDVPYTGIKCPFGKPGDRLWVRETLRTGGYAGGIIIQYKAGGTQLVKPHWDKQEREHYQTKEEWDWYHKNISTGQWRPSIHMPRWASRIILEVVSVRVERVQEIGGADALAEGIEKSWDGTAHWYKDYSPKATGQIKHRPIKSFATLWDSINAKRGLGWDVNPWVWVVGFRKETQWHLN